MSASRRSSFAVRRSLDRAKMLFVAIAALALCPTLERTALSQFVINFQIDQAEAAAALGADRLPAMQDSLARVKAALERRLAGSTATLTVPLRWRQIPGATAVGQTGFPLSTNRTYPWSLVRDRLISVAEGAGEPAGELFVYDFLPPQSVPFVWEGTTLRQANLCILTYAQAQQLQLNPIGPLGDELDMLIRPPGRFGTSNENRLQWQFFPGPVAFGNTRFAVVVAHEVLHLLGFLSAAETTSLPQYLSLQDAYRLADASFPTIPEDLSLAIRELRPTVDATFAARLNSSSGQGAYPMSRGSRPGGDSFSAPHFRSASRLNPNLPIGIMDPQSDQSPDARLGAFTVGDLEVLDLIGWTLDPAQGNNQIGTGPVPVITRPLAAERIRTRQPTVTWTDLGTTNEFYALNLFRGSPVFSADPDAPNNPEPMTFNDLPGFQFTIPASSVLAPGNYTAQIVGLSEENFTGQFTSSTYRQFTILARSDFNGDTLINVADIFAFLSAWFARCTQEGPAPCFTSVDYTGNGVIDVSDIFSFLNVWFARL